MPGGPGRARYQWPFEREPTFPASHAPNLAVAWRNSAARIRNIRDALSGDLPHSVACVAVSGSLARMEAHPESDIDLIIVVDDRHTPDLSTDADALWSHVWNQLDGLNVVRPKRGGIFSACARWKDLVDPAARGRIDESIITFGHRIQLLMDAQPVYAPDRFNALRRDILTWYSERHVAAIFDEPGPLHWLWQDVQRYWRSLRSRTCWLDVDSTSKSLLLNVKLRSSRLTLVFAFLQAIASAQSKPDADVIGSLMESLRHTPPERLFANDSDHAQPGIQAYDTVWRFLRDHARADVRQLPAEINQGLAALADAVSSQIASQNRHGLRPWLM